MQLFSFYFPWKFYETSGFQIISGEPVAWSGLRDTSDVSVDFKAIFMDVLGFW